MGLISKCYYAAVSILRVCFLKLRVPGFRCGKMPYFKGKIEFTFRKKSSVSFGSYIRVSDGTRIAVRDGGNLVIDDNVRINLNSIIYCHDSIKIGSNTQIGPFCQIYDHDHKFDTKEAFDNQEFLTAPVEIGDHCWIGANCIILRGTKIGDNCVVAAGTVLKGSYPENTMIYNKRDIVVRPYMRGNM